MESVFAARSLMAGPHREKVYPFNSLGAAIDGVQNTWSGTVVIVPVDAIKVDYGWEVPAVGATTDFTGLSIISKGSPTNAIAWQTLRVVKATETALNATSGAGEADASLVQIADTSKFLVDDWVWVKDDATPNGEIGKVSAIVANDYLDLVDDLANAYTVAQNAKVYLARRATANEYRSIWGVFAAGNTKEIRKFLFHAGRQLRAGDGLLMRVYDMENVASPGQIYATVIYDDEDD